MQKKLTLAFDIEGTLLDKTGKLDKDVIDIFKKADKDLTTFILLTGGNERVAQGALQQINEAIGGKEIKAWIGANGGGLIIDPNGNKVLDVHFPASVVDDVIKTSYKIDQNAVLIYATEKGNFVEKPRSVANTILLHFFKKHDEKKGVASIKLKELAHLPKWGTASDLIVKLGFIQEIFVYASNESKQKICEHLQKQYAGRYAVFDEKIISISANTKLQALYQICAMDKNAPQNVADVVYFGDGLNDLACLRHCKVSVARGEQAHDVVKQSAKYQLSNLSQFADELYGLSATNEILSKDDTANSAEQEK